MRDHTWGPNRPVASGAGDYLWAIASPSCMWHAVVFDARDELGRTLRAEGTVHNVLRWFGWPGRIAFWTLTHWQWADGQGWGENQEVWPLDQVRALLGNE